MMLEASICVQLVILLATWIKCSMFKLMIVRLHLAIVVLIQYLVVEGL